MAVRTIETDIKLTGEKEFNDQMKAVNSNLKVLKSDMAATSAEFEGNANSVEALTAKQKILQDSVDQQKVKVEVLRSKYKQVSDAYGENSAQADKWKQQLNNATVTLTFTQTPYYSYKSLLDWLTAAGTVTVVYDPTGAQEYCRDVTISSLQKGELNEVGWLDIPCSLLCGTPWYMPYPTELALETSTTDEIKRYDFSYSDELRYGSGSPSTLTCTIAGAGHIPGSLELTYHGAVTNPQIRLTGDVSGKTYGLCALTVVLEASDTLKISTRYENGYVKKVSAGGAETDLLDVLDLSTTPFFHIPVDEPCTISLEADAALDGVAELLIYYYYRSV